MCGVNKSEVNANIEEEYIAAGSSVNCDCCGSECFVETPVLFTLLSGSPRECLVAVGEAARGVCSIRACSVRNSDNDDSRKCATQASDRTRKWGSVREVVFFSFGDALVRCNGLKTDK